MRTLFSFVVCAFSLFSFQHLRADEYDLTSLHQVLGNAFSNKTYKLRYKQPNKPAPNLVRHVEALIQEISSSKYDERAQNDRGYRAWRTQVLNHLEHVNYEFIIRDDRDPYPHDIVLSGRGPVFPTLMALQKAVEFVDFSAGKRSYNKTIRFVAENPEKEKRLLKEQQDFAIGLTRDSVAPYIKMRDRLKKNRNASFEKEFSSMIEYLLLKLLSDPGVIEQVSTNDVLFEVRESALNALESVLDAKCPYKDTLEAIERALEFYDCYYRAIDPNRSPHLYHASRYEYYIHYLKGTTPDHVMMPTLAHLGATDLKRVRGVPIGFVGVNTDIAWVDGYYQTPLEFYFHDVNHSRRMFQFFAELAREQGKSIEKLAKESDAFVKEKLMPLLSMKGMKTAQERNHKRLIKMLLFEILHEDALPAFSSVIKEAVLRAAGTLTPFEEIDVVDGKKTVRHLMEPGATTLRYVYRKLVGDFYDMPGDRADYIVAPEYRTTKNVIKAAQSLFDALSIKGDYAETFAELAMTDEGLPEDFRACVERNIIQTHGDPLIDHPRIVERAEREIYRDPSFAWKRDIFRELEIVDSYQRGERLIVSLMVPVQGEEDKVPYQLQMPLDLFSVNKEEATLEQIKSSHYMIRISGGKYFSLETFKKEVLNKIPSHDHQYLIAIRANDSNAKDIIDAANDRGVESLLVVAEQETQDTTLMSPSYFFLEQSMDQVERSWDSLGEEALDLNYRESFDTDVPEMWKSFEKARLRRSFEFNMEILDKTGSTPMSLEDYAEKIALGRTPVFFFGSSLSIVNHSEEEQEKIKDMIHEALDGLDSDEIYLVTGGTDVGVEEMVQQYAQEKGFQVMAAISEEAKADSLNSGVTGVSVVSRNWEGRSKKVLSHIKSQGGFGVFIGGKDILSADIELADRMSVPYFAMKGVWGASHKKSLQKPDVGFEDARDLLSQVYQFNSEYVNESYRTVARNHLFHNVSKRLDRLGIESVSYEGLKDIARSYNRVVVIGGYVGLEYEDVSAVKKAVTEMVQKNGDNVLYITVGTYQGIGLVNDWIPQIRKKLGHENIITAGIVSRNVVSARIAHQDYIHFVDGAVTDWRNKDEEGTYTDVKLSQELNRTGTLTEHVFFGGGKISADTVTQLEQKDLPVTVYTGESMDPKRVVISGITGGQAYGPLPGHVAGLVSSGQKIEFNSRECSTEIAQMASVL